MNVAAVATSVPDLIQEKDRDNSSEMRNDIPKRITLTRTE